MKKIIVIFLIFGLVGCSQTKEQVEMQGSEQNRDEIIEENINQNEVTDEKFIVPYELMELNTIVIDNNMISLDEKSQNELISIFNAENLSEIDINLSFKNEFFIWSNEIATKSIVSYKLLDDTIVFEIHQQGNMPIFVTNLDLNKEDLDTFLQNKIGDSPANENVKQFIEVFDYLNQYILQIGFGNTNQIKIKSSIEDFQNYDYSTSTFSDDGIAMAVYGYLSYIGHITDSKVGIERKIWDETTMKYFDKTIDINKTSLVKIDENTGNVISTGWGYNGMFQTLIPKSITKLTDNKFLIEAYKIELATLSNVGELNVKISLLNNNFDVLENYKFVSEMAYVFEKKDDFYRLIAELNNGMPTSPYKFLIGSEYRDYVE